MIDAKELRIGNFVNFWKPNISDTNRAVSIHDIADICEGLNDIFGSSVYAIPITPEWLERFGFEFRRDVRIKKPSFKKYTNRGEDAFFKAHFYTGQAGEKIFSSVWYVQNGYFNVLDHIQHVHQLQNLYFALTGDELTLKDGMTEI